MPAHDKVSTKAYELIAKLNEISKWKERGLYYTLIESNPTSCILVISDGENYKEITRPIPKVSLSGFLISLIRLALAEGVFENVGDNASVN